jgi:pyrroline-5-carboxylate reductase
MTSSAKTPETFTEDANASNSQQVRLPALAMLGVGSMGKSILAGLQSPGVSTAGPIRVTTHSQSSAEQFESVENVSALSVEARADANRLAVQDADIVVLAVKPWMIHDVLHEVANDLKNGATVVSVAAGITLRSMQKIAPEHVTVARAMPNTPSLIGLGVTGLAFADNTPENTRRVVREVFSTVGEVIEVDESQIDALSAISGSGPAYVYWFTEQLTEAAKRLGFTDEDAQTMAENTVVGAANLMNRSEKDPAALRRDVTSPNGTTEQAIHVFADSDFDLTVDEALQAAIRRARELAAE